MLILHPLFPKVSCPLLLVTRDSLFFVCPTQDVNQVKWRNSLKGPMLWSTSMICLGPSEGLNSSVSTLRSLWFRRSQVAFLMTLLSRGVSLLRSLKVSPGKYMRRLVTSRLHKRLWRTPIPFIVDSSNLHCHSLQICLDSYIDREGQSGVLGFLVPCDHFVCFSEWFHRALLIGIWLVPRRE